MPTEHDHWEYMIPDYLSGRLSSDEANRLSEHLGGCPECTATVRELRLLFHALEQEKSHAGGASYFATILPRVRARLESADAKRRWWRVPDLAVAGAALVVVLGLVWSVARLGGGSAPEDQALSEAVRDVPADVLVQLLDAQADQAGILENPAGGMMSMALLDNVLAEELSGEQAVLSMLDVSPESGSIWLSNLNDAEVTTLLQRFNEREIL